MKKYLTRAAGILALPFFPFVMILTLDDNTTLPEAVTATWEAWLHTLWNI